MLDVWVGVCVCAQVGLSCLVVVTDPFVRVVVPCIPGKGRQAVAEDGVAATLILQGFLDAHVLVEPPAAEQQ